MVRFLCQGGTNAGTIIIYAVLILVLIAMLVMPYFSNKKKNQEFVQMLDSIRVGDLVKTAGGIIGKVTKITDKGEIKTIILETGSKTEKSYMEFDMSMIYCVLKSTKPVEEKKDDSDKDAKTETKTEEKNDVVELDAKTVEEKKEVVAEKVEEKKTTKKTPTKKTTTKKSTKKVEEK